MEKFKVKEDHLTGAIADFPLHVVQAMVDEQVRQGNKADPSVFTERDNATKAKGGFDWVKTNEGDDFWSHVIELKRFQLIPLPKNRTQADEGAMTEAVEPKRKIVQICESITSDDRYASPWNLTALCDDGTVWIRSDGTGDWVRLPDIPQDGE